MEFRSKYEKRPIQESELPFDVINEMILTRLPIKSVVRFKSVSKLWYSTLSSPRFAHAHLKMFNPSTTQSVFLQYVFENKFKILSYEDGDQSSQMDNKCEIDWVNEKVDFDIGKEYVYLVGSCNGLVCLGSTSGCLFIIWNPITREFFKYRDSKISKVAGGGRLVTWGFGYVSSVDDYKVVRICRDDICDFMRVYVYSTRFGKLKIIDNSDDSHNFSGLRKTNYLVNHGVLVNETLYWMDNAPKIPSLMNGLPREILSFDLATEIFGTFPHLEVSTPSRNARDKDAFSDELLCEFNGCLSKYGRSMKTGKNILTMLKSPRETEQVLFPSFLGGGCSQHVIGFTRSNKIFTECYNDNLPYSTSDLCLVVIDLTFPPLEHIQLMNLEVWECRHIAKYSASLISPDARVRRMPGDE